MEDSKPKRPRDPLELAKLIGDIATKQREDTSDEEKDPAAVERGRMGGKVGGKARAKKMSPEERSQSARKAAKARWSKT